MISLSRYSALLAERELRTTIAASVIGRLPIGITGLSILLLMQRTTGSFAESGAMTAAYLAGLASIAPLLGRAIDRSGPRRILTACALVFPAALCSLVAATQVAPDRAVYSALAFVAGASFPPITVCMRTFFRQRIGDDARLAAAFSLESVLIELIFIVGPTIVALLVAIASPQAAVLAAAFSSAAGSVLFLRSPAVARWRVEPRTAPSLFGPLGERNFPALLAVVLGYATAFGLVEIGVTAYASDANRPALAGVLLALMSAGSALGGLAYGSRTWGMPLTRQFSVALTLMGAGIAFLAAVDNAWIFAPLCFVAGLVMAPALTIQAMLVAKIAHARYATEAFTWSSTSLLAGVALGMACGGWLVERSGWSAALSVAGIAAFASGALAPRLRAEH